MTRTIDDYKSRLQDRERAEKYAKRFESGSRRRIDWREQKAVRRILAELPACQSVLDVPSGAGRFLATLSHGGAKVICADAAVEVLEFARENARRHNLAARLVHANAAQMPLASGSVDLVFCNRLLHHILEPADRRKILRELCRVTRRFVAVSFFDYRRFGGLRRLFKRLKGRTPPYQGQPSLEEFAAEAGQVGLHLQKVIPTGAFWVSQKYLVLEKQQP